MIVLNSDELEYLIRLVEDDAGKYLPNQPRKLTLRNKLKCLAKKRFNFNFIPHPIPFRERKKRLADERKKCAEIARTFVKSKGPSTKASPFGNHYKTAKAQHLAAKSVAQAIAKRIENLV